MLDGRDRQCEAREASFAITGTASPKAVLCDSAAEGRVPPSFVAAGRHGVQVCNERKVRFGLASGQPREDVVAGKIKATRLNDLGRNLNNPSLEAKTLHRLNRDRYYGAVVARRIPSVAFNQPSGKLEEI